MKKNINILVYATSVFMFSLFYIIYIVMKKVFFVEKIFQVVLFYAIILLCIVNVRIPTELFYWFTGACVYTIPLSFGCIGVAAFIQVVLGENKKRYIVLATVCGFLACGGVLQIAAAVCYINLCLLLWYFMSKGKDNKKLITVDFIGMQQYIIHYIMSEMKYIT